jgi:hypothetical protein
MKNSIFILVISVLSSTISDAQVREFDSDSKSILDRLYFKAGAELFSYSSDNFRSRGGVNGMNLIGSFMYDYLDKIQLEFVYRYNVGRDNKNESLRYGTVREYTDVSKHEELTGNGFDLKVNYFMNRDRTENPVYFVGALGIDIQNRQVYENFQYVNMFVDTMSGYSMATASYNRLLLGPSLGVGIFLDFGKVNVQSEVNAGFRIAPFVDRGYKEFILSIGLSPIYKF